MLSQHSLACADRGSFDAVDGAVGLALDCWGVESDELTAPPDSLRPFFRHGGKPILPDHGAHFAWRLLGKGILRKEIEHGVVVRKQSHFGAENNRVFPP